jgi:hypothetical protein
MARMSLALSDGLVELATMLSPFQHETRVLEPHDARTLCQLLKELGKEARSIENRLSAKLWNEAAREDSAAEAERIAAAASQPGSNVKLFPVIPRPFHDGLGGRA